MLDPGRYRPSITVFGTLFLLIFALERASGLLLALPVSRWSPDREALKLTQQLSLAAKQSGEQFGLIVGNSSALEGYSVDQLEDLTGLKWLNLSIKGRSLDRLVLALDPYFHAELKPEIIVLGLHPLVVQEQRGDSVVKDMREFYSTFLEKAALAIQGPAWPKGSHSSPFIDQPQLSGPPQRHAMTVQLNGMTELGTFDPNSYEPNTREARVLKSFLQRLSTDQAKLVLVKMPERPELHNSVPEAADQVFSSLITEFPVLDLGDFLKDEEFVDVVHANELGRQRITAEVAHFLISKGLLTP